jgi:hypothetical protein
MSTRIRGRLPATRPHDIDHVLGALGIEGYQAGGELSARCPLHGDRRASFSINTISGLWICHAGCGQGTLAGLVAKATGQSVTTSKRWLRGVGLGDRLDDDWEEGEFEPYDEDWYFKSFSEPPETALKERRISPVAAADLSIRWGSWTAANGLYGRGWAYDPSWGAWILPVRHPDTHDLLGWQTKIVGDVEEGHEETKTTKGTRKSRSLFGIDVFEPGTTVILVESPLDAARLLTVGVTGAVASFGAGVSRTQLQLLADRASTVVLALDNDDAGRRGTRKAARSDELAGKELYLLSYEHAPDVKDPGEMSACEIWQGLRTAKRITR